MNEHDYFNDPNYSRAPRTRVWCVLCYTCKKYREETIEAGNDCADERHRVWSTCPCGKGHSHSVQEKILREPKVRE